jgi:hypothetical protein
MAPTPAAHRPESSNALGRRRDAALLWLLERHPATADMLVEVGFFTSAARAGKRLRRLVRTRQLRVAGTVALKGGRPAHVYCRYFSAVKADNLLHEVQVSRICFKVHADEVRRGPGEVDPDLRPDAEVWISGQRYLLEFDNATTGYDVVVQRRFTKYRSCPYLVLWVCATEPRTEGLRRRAEMIRETALFTTLDRALADPHAAIWTDFDGGRAALPRSERGGRKGSSKGSP